MTKDDEIIAIMPQFLYWEDRPMAVEAFYETVKVYVPTIPNQLQCEFMEMRQWIYDQIKSLDKEYIFAYGYFTQNKPSVIVLKRRQ